MTVRLTRAFAGLPAGASYDGPADVELDLVTRANAEWSIKSVSPAGGPGDDPLADSSPVLCTDQRFRGYWDGTHDDGPAIAAAAAYAASVEPRRAIMLPPIVGVASSIYIPARVHVLGYGYSPGKINTRVIPLTGASFSTGFIFNMNTTDGTTQAETQTAAAAGYWNGLFGIYLDNSVNDVDDTRLCIFAYWFKACDLKGWKHNQLIKKLESSYADNMQIENVSCLATHDFSEYSIEILGGGDCLKIHNINFGSLSTAHLGIKVETGNSIEISNVINGTISLKNVNGGTIDSLHQENGQVLLENTSVTIRNFTSQLHTGDTYYPIDCIASGDANANYTVLLDSAVFRKIGPSFDGTPLAEVRLDPQYTFTSINSVRQIGDGGNKSTIGIRVNDDTDTAIAAWNNNAGYLSLQGSIVNGVAHGSDNASIPANDILGAYNAITKVTGYGDSTLANGTTYYYKTQFLLDKTAMVGRNQTNAELSTTMSAANQRNYFPISYGTSSGIGILRIYRGTATNSYDNYADVPVINARAAVDTGALVLDTPWVSRSAGPVDSITAVLGSFRVTPDAGAIGVYTGESSSVGDADATIGLPGYTESTVLMATTLTADRSYTINSSLTTVGVKVRFVRTAAGTGAFNAIVKNPSGTTLKSLSAASTWCVAELTNGGNWRLVANGSL